MWALVLVTVVILALVWSALRSASDADDLLGDEGEEVCGGAG